MWISVFCSVEYLEQDSSMFYKWLTANVYKVVTVFKIDFHYDNRRVFFGSFFEGTISLITQWNKRSSAARQRRRTPLETPRISEHWFVLAEFNGSGNIQGVCVGAAVQHGGVTCFPLCNRWGEKGRNFLTEQTAIKNSVGETGVLGLSTCDVFTSSTKTNPRLDL